MQIPKSILSVVHQSFIQLIVENQMAKGKDSKEKSGKKTAAKSLKEKRADKANKRKEKINSSKV